jgi:iron complex outermembrane receptor protein
MSHVAHAAIPANDPASAPDDKNRENPSEASVEEAKQTEKNSQTVPRTTVFDEILIGAPMSPLIGPEGELGRKEITEIPYGDAAEVLRSVSGLALGRMGGHGLEPRLRGLGETNINVLLDGAYVHNACPNRMDPPTSFGAVESFDRVVVLKGVQTVRYGGGGSAGTILYQRETPRFQPSESWRLRLGSSWASHSNEPDLTVDAATGSSHYYLRIIGERRNVGDYEDGGANKVRSAFKKQDASIAVGWTPDARTSIELSYERNLTEDALFPGSGMDAPYDENNLYRLAARRLRGTGRVTAIESDLYWGEIDHLMDNYTLRPLTMPMASKAETSSDTFGGRVSVDARAGDRFRYTIGADFQQNTRRAVRLAGPSPEVVNREQSILWPDAEIVDAGVFAESVVSLGERRRVLVGARLDRFRASVSEADREPFGPNLSPRSLYDLYYEETAAEWSQTDVGGLVRFEHGLAGGATVFAGLSRSVRPADATERFLASNNALPGMRWIGNPALDASRHHQLDIGLSASRPRHLMTGVVFFDRVDDYILRDRARAQSGILLSDRATIYRNVDAELIGVELDGWWRLSESFSLTGNAGWVRAENRTDQRPIAQIPPLQGRIRLDFERGPWQLATNVRYALEQSRVDDDPATGSGLDRGPTPGYAVLDVITGHQFGSGVVLQMGIENLFDRLYADHLNRANLFDVEQIRVNEPGRTVWVRIRFEP